MLPSPWGKPSIILHIKIIYIYIYYIYIVTVHNHSCPCPMAPSLLRTRRRTIQPLESFAECHLQYHFHLWAQPFSFVIRFTKFVITVTKLVIIIIKICYYFYKIWFITKFIVTIVTKFGLSQFCYCYHKTYNSRNSQYNFS